MPRIKPLTQAEEKNRKLMSSILGQMGYEGKNHKQMAEAIGMEYHTWLNRKKNPGKFTVEEIRRIKRVLPGLELGI